MAIKLKDFQLEAVNNLKPGKILCGDVGSGKSLTSLAYYFKYNGFNIKDIESTLANKKIKEEKKFKNLYIITTPQKRDKHEWDLELARFCLDLNKDNPIIIIDSWNNIKKYINICNSFFIFDEQRVVGSGAWVKAFLKITKSNDWILLSATPGDTYMDYVPVMIANKFYKNKTEFIYNHVIYNRFTKYPKIDKYIRTEIIDNHINKLLVNLKKPETKIYHITELHCRYDIELYNKVIKDRWNPFEAKPIQTSSEFCKILRTINNSNIDRLNYVRELYFKHKKIIVFYNFDFELDLILQLKKEGIVVSQWNGHKHEKIPFEEKWIHAVQYFAGNEGWNCIDTDTIVFYSNNYSYRIMKQASGRIDRINSSYKDLYYYMLVTDSNIEKSILRAIKDKKAFNEKNFSANFGI